MAYHGASLSSRRVFTDSSAYLAILDRRDEHHAEAMTILGELAHGRYPLFTTTTIVIEAHALILSALGREQARRFLRDIEASQTRIIQVRARSERSSRRAITYGIIFIGVNNYDP